MSDISQIDTEVGGLSGPKREHERVHFNGLVRIAVPNGKEMDVFSENVSLGGIFLRSNRPLPIGQKVALDFETDRGHVRVQEGEVRWSHQFGMFETDGIPGMGVQFSKLERGSQKIIGAFVDEILETKINTTNSQKGPRQFIENPTQIDYDFRPQPSTIEFQVDTIIEPDQRIAESIAKAVDAETKKQIPWILLRKKAKPALLGLLFATVIMVILFNPFRKSNDVVSTSRYPRVAFDTKPIKNRPFDKKKADPVVQKQAQVSAKATPGDRIKMVSKPVRLARPVFRRNKAQWQMELVIGQTNRIKHYTLTNPCRLVVDFFQARWIRESKMRLKVPFIKRARFGNQPQKARLVLDFIGDSLPRYMISRKDDRIAIQFQSTKPTE